MRQITHDKQMKQRLPSIKTANKFGSHKRSGAPLLAYAFGVLTIGILGLLGFLMFGRFPAPQKLVTVEISHDRFQF